MIIWTGRGILTPLILAVAIILTAAIPSKEVASFLLPFAFIAAGTANWRLGNKWNNKEGRVIVDETTGQRTEYKPNHSLFFIKMQYWGILFIALGGLMVAIDVVLSLISFFVN
ncbi:MAG: hypothetical protein ABJH72_16310 [Reichenbachiella sp.]|uniref:hypothetical protein n=1 Tax=Reichenbachiella sp. TaxID=2184521 RepID=UPI003267AC36